jgi:hypothetical protein
VTLQPELVIGLHAVLQSATPGIVLPLPSPRPRAQMVPPEQSPSTSQKVPHESPVGVIWRQMSPGWQPVVEHSWPSVPVPAMTQLRAPVASIVHSSPPGQPHSGATSSHGEPVQPPVVVDVGPVVVVVVVEVVVGPLVVLGPVVEVDGPVVVVLNVDVVEPGPVVWPWLPLPAPVLPPSPPKLPLSEPDAQAAATTTRITAELPRTTRRKR